MPVHLVGLCECRTCFAARLIQNDPNNKVVVLLTTEPVLVRMPVSSGDTDNV